ncbi:hypothetical protein NP493_924g01018 [Ridgeia piscesae]|uniref:Protein SCAI n=1 Tax=Ridgeia piscesae TaxID=27915 RepID=A0AAD9NJQ3_RIDPI|nr:hypothetical protein NP493_924g01018 [Ridgeia piscesae]
MFHMLQTLEREPQEDFTNQIFDASPASSRLPFDGSTVSKRENPHKYLLYKPTFDQLYTFLSSGFKELPSGGATLIYISSDGCVCNSNQSADIAFGFGGVVTNSRREPDYTNKAKWQGNTRDIHCLHPGDLYPFTRKPLFIIVDSDNSSAFQEWPNLFGQPLVCLLSPEQLPSTFQGQKQKGNLFTLFLHSVLTAFCYVCDISKISISLWEKCQAHVDRFTAEASKLFTRSSSLDHCFMQFFGDDFLRVLLLRFIFCYVVLRLHRAFSGQQFYPLSFPRIPQEEILDNLALQKIVLELASTLEVGMLFHTTEELN